MTIERAYRRILPLMCLAGLAVIGCDDDDDDGNGLGPAPADVQQEAVAIVGVMRAAEDLVDLSALLAGDQIIPGVQGQLVIGLTTWSFEEYSPDGALVIDGVLTVNPTSTPMAVAGALEMTGSQEGTAEVDMTIDVDDPDNWVWGGTVTYKGYPLPVADLVAAAEAGQ